MEVKKMKNEKVKELFNQLEEGVKKVYDSENYKNMLTVMSKFHNYSANNCILILLQCPTATFVAGYKSWQNNFKRQVKKGEKAIKILAPSKRKYTKTETDENGNESEKEIEYMAFYPTYVFDISQTEGEDLPTVCHELKGDIDGFKSLFDGIKKATTANVSIGEVDGQAKGYFSPNDNKIVVKAGMEETQTIKTLIHEVAHSILHRKDGEQEQATHNTKEVQAESVAYIVSNYLGIDTSEYSFGYVAGWSTGKDVKELKESLDVIQKTASKIISCVA